MTDPVVIVIKEHVAYADMPDKSASAICKYFEVPSIQLFSTVNDARRALRGGYDSDRHNISAEQQKNIKAIVTGDRVSLINNSFFPLGREFSKQEYKTLDLYSKDHKDLSSSEIVAKLKDEFSLASDIPTYVFNATPKKPIVDLNEFHGQMIWPSPKRREDEPVIEEFTRS